MDTLPSKTETEFEKIENLISLLLDIVKKMREKSGPTISRSAENMYDALLKYGIDFTERAKEGKLE